MSKITIKNIDTNLLSGSNDRTRNMIGGFWQLSGTYEGGSVLVYKSAPSATTTQYVSALHTDAFETSTVYDFVTASATSIIPKIPAVVLTANRPTDSAAFFPCPCNN